MSNHATLSPVAEKTDQTTTREHAGAIVGRLIDYRGTTIDELGTRGRSISPMTIRRIIKGDERATDSKYLTLDSLLGLPVGTLLRVVDNDAAAVRALPWRPDDSYVRDFILGEMAGTATGSRGSTVSSKATKATRRTG